MAEGPVSIQKRFEQMPEWAKAVMVAAIAAVALVAGVAVANAFAPKLEEPSLDALVEDAVAAPVEVASQQGAAEQPDSREVADTARSALDAASVVDAVNVFDAVTGIDRALGEAEAPEVAQAVEAFHEAGYSVGFVVYDLVTQRGMGYNANATFFSASTVKAPFVAYAVQDEVGSGRAAFEDEVAEDVVMEGTGVMAFDDASAYRLEDVLSNTIVHSDNTGYALLRERFDDGGFEAWCAAASVDATAWEGEWYPYCTPLDLAKLWLNVGSYVAAGQEGGAWCADVLSQTDSSFLRVALGDRGTVLSKPGFEIDTPWYDIGALNDAGVVLSDKGAYVVAVMSDADYDSDYFTDNEHLIVDLASALGAAHDAVLVRSESEVASL